ncbi:MAG TPA: SRPBCC family protein [Marmoricola sp.]|nr:SRPBCC family protein [Marmoricola sp.]
MGHLRRVGRRTGVIDVSVEIPLPAEVVWDFLADIQDAEPIPRRAVLRMVKEPPGPTVAGTRWHEAVRFVPGLWLHVESVVTQASRPSLLAMTFHSRWWSGDLRYEITDRSGGCLLRHRETVLPHLLLRPLTGWIEHRLRSRVLERLRDIHDVLLASCREDRAAPS